MRQNLFFIAPIVCFALLSVGCNQPAASNHTTSVPLEMLDGQWADLSKNSYYIEEWKYLGDDRLKGVGYVLSNEHVTYIENLEIGPKDGVLTYTVRISGQSSGQTVDFKLVSNSNNRMVFENPDNDFPGRITYEMQTRSTMFLWLEGVENGVSRKTRFIFERQ